MKSKNGKVKLTERQLLEEKAQVLWIEISDKLNNKQFESNEIDILWVKLMKIYKSESFGQSDREIKNLKNQRWTSNHMKIKQTIDHFVRENFCLPSTYEIARRLGLSRQTVSKHLREFDTKELYKEEMKAYEFSSNMLLERVLSMAVNGDLKAIKFYISVMERRRQEKQTSSTNNFIQINNIYVNEKTIKALAEDKRNTIEKIILSENLRVLKTNEFSKVDKS